MKNSFDLKQSLEAEYLVKNAVRTISTLTRDSFGGGDQFGNHDIDADCGYPLSLDPVSLWKWFKRNDMGYRMTVVKPNACWSKNPRIIENEDQEETEFEKQIKELDVKHNFWNYLERADIISGVGSFGLVMLGIDDGKDFATPVANINKKRKSKQELKYVRIFAQHQVQIETFVNDPKNPRFGLPEMYCLTFESEATAGLEGVSTISSGGTNATTITQRVHWTRIVHLADNRDTSDVYGSSRLQRIYNRLIDYRKVVGGSAEMYWKGAFPGLSIESQPDFADAEFNKEATKEAIDNYQDGLNRYLALQGMTIKSLTPQIADPTNNYKMLVMAIAMAEGIPYRILLGAEEGKQAGNQDVTQWNTKMEGRRLQYLNPLVIRPILNRLIEMGVLNDTLYTIKWPTLNEQTVKEQIENALNRTKALAEYMRGGVDMIVTQEDFLKIFLKVDEEEVKTIMSNIDHDLDSDTVDEEEVGKFQKELALKKSVKMDPNGNPQGQQTKQDENKV